MDNFIVPPITTTHERVHEILGKDWLQEQVEAIRNATKKKASLHPARMSPAFGWITHPLVSEARKGISEPGTPLLDSLETDLIDLENMELPSNLGERLKSDHDCIKVAYELRIAAGFCRLGYPIEWIPPSTQPRPEFFVFLKDSSSLSVECKKRDKYDGYEEDGARFWRHLQYSLRIKMEEASLNYWVKVTGRSFHLQDIDALVSEIISELQSKEQGQCESKVGHYRIEYTKLADPDKAISMYVVNMFPRGVFGINMGKQKRNQIMKGPLTNPKLLRLEVIDDPEHRVKGLLRNLDTAAHQVIEGIPNLVYIDTNIPYYEKEQQEFGNFIDAIKSELAHRHRQISAVIVTNIYPALTLDEYLGWRVRTELIEHPDPLVKLPQGLLFPGDAIGTQWLPGEPSVRVE